MRRLICFRWAHMSESTFSHVGAHCIKKAYFDQVEIRVLLKPVSQEETQ